MFLKNDKSNPKAEIHHEIMHAIALQHTFSETPGVDKKKPYIFKMGKTDNYMDYKNTIKHTYKWQWDQLHKSILTTE